MDLKARVLEGELMDAPDLDSDVHHRALRGLERVNVLSGTAQKIVDHLLPIMKRSSRPGWRILDLASGGGDVTLQIAHRLISSGLDVSVEGWDRSPTAIAHAHDNLRRLAVRHPQLTSRVSFENRDLFDAQSDHLASSRGNFDVIMCTLFLHHLTHDEAVSLLSRAYAATTSMVLVDDLRRSWLGYRLAQLGCQILTRSPIVHVDGPLSVRAAFTLDELHQLSRQAGLPNPTVSLHWPQRFLACWQRMPS